MMKLTKVLKNGSAPLISPWYMTFLYIQGSGLAYLVMTPDMPEVRGLLLLQ